MEAHRPGWTGYLLSSVGICLQLLTWVFQLTASLTEANSCQKLHPIHGKGRKASRSVALNFWRVTDLSKNIKKIMESSLQTHVYPYKNLQLTSGCWQTDSWTPSFQVSKPRPEQGEKLSHCVFTQHVYFLPGGVLATKMIKCLEIVSYSWRN